MRHVWLVCFVSSYVHQAISGVLLEGYLVWRDLYTVADAVTCPCYMLRVPSTWYQVWLVCFVSSYVDGSISGLLLDAGEIYIQWLMLCVHLSARGSSPKARLAGANYITSLPVPATTLSCCWAVCLANTNTNTKNVLPCQHQPTVSAPCWVVPQYLEVPQRTVKYLKASWATSISPTSQLLQGGVARPEWTPPAPNNT